MVSKDLKIEIRPVPGRNGIKKFSENLEYFSQAHTVPPLVDPDTLKYATGLTEEDIEYLEKQNFPYEFKDDNYQEGKAHPFWESQLVKTKLVSSPMFLFPGKSLIDFIKWKYLSASSYVYRSEEEMRTGVKPEATHYIYNESEAVKVKAKRLEKRNSLVRRIADLSLKRKRDIVLILLNENTENKNEDYLTVKFEQIMNDAGDRKQLELLLEKSEADVSLSAEIKAAIQKNVLRKTKQGIYFFETNLGFGEEDVQAFLAKPENQEILITIKSKIEQ